MDDYLGGLFIFIVLMVGFFSFISFLARRHEIAVKAAMFDKYIEYKKQLPNDRMPAHIERILAQ